MKRTIIMTLLVLIAFMQMASAASVTGVAYDLKTYVPVNVDSVNNPASECKEFGCGISYVDLGNTAGTFERVTSGGTPVEITIEIAETKADSGEPIAFNWTSNVSVCTVIVKADSGVMVYSYSGGSLGDDYVWTYNYPTDIYGVSHITFCYKDGSVVENPIPEFPTIALPIAAILGMALFFQRRKE